MATDKAPPIASVQVLRFVAATVVVVHHLLKEINESDRLGLSRLIDPTHIEWRVGVDIFFVTSGFVMVHITREHFRARGYPLEFLKRRVARVAPTYWFYTTLYIAISSLMPGNVNTYESDPWLIVCSYLFLPCRRSDGSIYPVLILGWTLNYEMYFYVMYALALRFRRRAGLAILCVVMASFIALNALLRLRSLEFVANPILLEFLAGIGLGWAYERGVRLHMHARFALAAVALGMLSWVGALGWVSDGWRPVWAGIPSALVFAAFVLGDDFDTTRPSVRWLVDAGDASYSLYLTHMITIRVVSILWPRLGIQITELYFATALCACMAGGYVAHKLIERPLCRLARNLHALLPSDPIVPTGASIERRGP